MDPNQAYSDLLEAIESHDHETAREKATALKHWLAKGGFYPVRYSFEEVDRMLATVLATTASKPPFSLTCWYCDAGQGTRSEDEALSEGWTEIQPAPQLLQANYLGVCPDCRGRHES